MSWQQGGVTRPAAGWWRPVLVALAGVVAFQAVVGPMGDPALSAETVAFQALVPGFDEELLFRGILLVLLDRAFTVQRQLWGNQVGWAVPITTLLFGLLHGLHLAGGLALVFEPVAVVATGTAGLLLAWIRTSTASGQRSCCTTRPTPAS